MTIETKELIISEELKRKIEFICRFTNVNYPLTNGNIKSIKNTNLAYIEPHKLVIGNTTYLFFDECENVYIDNLEN